MRSPPLLLLQCVGSVRAVCAGMPIRQLAFNCSQKRDQEPLLLAARTPYWLCFFEVVLVGGGVPLEETCTSEQFSL